MTSLATQILEIEPLGILGRTGHSEMYMHGFNDALFLAAKLVEGFDLEVPTESGVSVEQLRRLMEPYKKR